MNTTPNNIIFDLGGVLIEWAPQTIVRDFTGNPTVQERIMQGIAALLPDELHGFYADAAD